MGLVGDRHGLSVTGSLFSQDVSVYRPEPGAAEEGPASRKAESVSVLRAGGSYTLPTEGLQGQNPIAVAGDQE